jgi:hypothetical protein
MNLLVALFLACASAAQLLLPRRLAALALLMTFAWIPRAQVVELGDIKITAFRLIIAVGVVRGLLRHERLPSPFSSMDLAWVLWSMAMVATWTLHTSNDLAFRVGLVWDYLGAYYLIRLSLSSYADIERLFMMFCAVLIPVALLMLIERHTGENPLGDIGGLPTQWREGKFRAAGSFSHPILAGTVGATCLLMGLTLWRLRAGFGILGILTGAAIVYASASSGPMMMTAFGICGLALWRYRARLKGIRWSLLGLALIVQLAMQDPIYFLMAKIDVVGGSTGWHRARLIQASFEHFGEWWLAGTDRTIHWMPTGIQANDQHTDLTNHFLAMGVIGGLPVLVPFVAAVILLIRRVDREFVGAVEAEDRHQFLAWSVGALMFAHATNFLSANLFDQSIVSFMLLFSCAGVIGQRPVLASQQATTSPVPPVEPQDVEARAMRWQ